LTVARWGWYQGAMARNKNAQSQSKEEQVSGVGRAGKYLAALHVSRAEVLLLTALYGSVLAIAHWAGMFWGLLALAVALLVAGRLVARLLRYALWEQWKRIDRETRDTELLASGFDWRPVVVLSVVAVVLIGNNYFGHRQHFRYIVAQIYKKPADAPYLKGASFRNAGSHGGVQLVYQRRFVARYGSWAHIIEFAYWVGWRVVGFLLLPIVVVLLLPGESLGDYGLRTKGLTKHLWIYLVLFMIVLPAVILVSYTPAFRSHYPFPWSGGRIRGDVHGSQLLTWELMYAAQFFSLEFFFRGFMLNALRRSMGAYAIFAMVVPYCMIHFGKPIAETFGAIAAGLVLGTLALGTRSIWSGFFIHVSVALSMDLAALVQKGALPRLW